LTHFEGHGLVRRNLSPRGERKRRGGLGRIIRRVGKEDVVAMLAGDPLAQILVPDVEETPAVRARDPNVAAQPKAVAAMLASAGLAQVFGTGTQLNPAIRARNPNAFGHG
jgi:hypothetical protein